MGGKVLDIKYNKAKQSLKDMLAEGSVSLVTRACSGPLLGVHAWL